MLNNALVTALAAPKVGRSPPVEEVTALDAPKVGQSPPPQEVTAKAAPKVKDGCFIHYSYLI